MIAHPPQQAYEHAPSTGSLSRAGGPAWNRINFQEPFLIGLGIDCQHMVNVVFDLKQHILPQAIQLRYLSLVYHKWSPGSFSCMADLLEQLFVHCSIGFNHCSSAVIFGIVFGVRSFVSDCILPCMPIVVLSILPQSSVFVILRSTDAALAKLPLPSPYSLFTVVSPYDGCEHSQYSISTSTTVFQSVVFAFSG